MSMRNRLTVQQIGRDHLVSSLSLSAGPELRRIQSCNFTRFFSSVLCLFLFQAVLVGQVSGQAGYRVDEQFQVDLIRSRGGQRFVPQLYATLSNKVLIHGAFEAVNGVKRVQLARLNSDGSTDLEFDSGAIAELIYSLDVYEDGRILLHLYALPAQLGQTEQIPQSTVVRLLPNGAIDPAFKAVTSASVAALEDGKAALFAPTYGWPYKEGLIVLNADGSKDEGFRTPWSSASVYAVARAGGKRIYVAARIQESEESENVWVFKLVRLNSDGTIDPSFTMDEGVGLYEFMRSIHPQRDGRVVLFGSFTVKGSSERSSVVRFGPDGSLDPTYRLTGEPLAVCPQDKLIVLRRSQVVITAKEVYRGLADGSATSDSSGIGANINCGQYRPVCGASAVVLEDGSTLIGVIEEQEPFDRRYMTMYRWDPKAVRDRKYNPIFQRSGYATKVLATPDGGLLVRGTFERVGDFGATNLVKLKADATPDTIATARLQPFREQFSNAVAVDQQGRIVIGQSSLSRFLANGELDASFKGEVFSDKAFYSIVPLPSRKIIAVVAPQPPPYFGTNWTILRFEENGSLDASFFDEKEYDRPKVFPQPDGKLVVLTRHGLLRLLENGTSDVAFARSDVVARINQRGTPEPANVNTVAFQKDGQILVGLSVGTQTEPNGNPLVRFTADGVRDPSFLPNFAGVPHWYPTGGFSYVCFVSSIGVQDDGRIWVSGEFQSIEGVLRRSFARLNADGSLDRTFSDFEIVGGLGPGEFDLAPTLLPMPDGSFFINGTFNGVGGFARLGIARLVPDAPEQTQVKVNPAGNLEWLLRTTPWIRY